MRHSTLRTSTQSVRLSTIFGPECARRVRSNAEMIFQMPNDIPTSKFLGLEACVTTVESRPRGAIQEPLAACRTRPAVRLVLVHGRERVHGLPGLHTVAHSELRDGRIAAVYLYFDELP
jgi:hypothetical protein